MAHLNTRRDHDGLQPRLVATQQLRLSPHRDRVCPRQQPAIQPWEPSQATRMTHDDPARSISRQFQGA